MNGDLLSHTNLYLGSNGTIHVNECNLKGAEGFDSKFPFDCVVILEDLMSNN